MFHLEVSTTFAEFKRCFKDQIQEYISSIFPNIALFLTISANKLVRNRQKIVKNGLQFHWKMYLRYVFVIFPNSMFYLTKSSTDCSWLSFPLNDAADCKSRTIPCYPHTAFCWDSCGPLWLVTLQNKSKIVSQLKEVGSFRDYCNDFNVLSAALEYVFLNVPDWSLQVIGSCPLRHSLKITYHRLNW